MNGTILGSIFVCLHDGTRQRYYYNKTSLQPARICLQDRGDITGEDTKATHRKDGNKQPEECDKPCISSAPLKRRRRYKESGKMAHQAKEGLQSRKEPSAATICCQCKGCTEPHDESPSGVCGIPFFPEDGTRCFRCNIANCPTCAVKCGQCGRGLCLECDLCPWCECTVCRYCVVKKRCDGCEKTYCSDARRCDVKMRTCDYCGNTVCETCSYRLNVSQCHGCSDDGSRCGRCCCEECCANFDRCEKCRGVYCEECHSDANRHSAGGPCHPDGRDLKKLKK